MLMEYVSSPTLCCNDKTRSNYLTAAKSFVEYRKGKDVDLTRLTERQVLGYQQWLMERGLCRNTISCYIRSLRSLYNKGVAKRRRNGNPFANAFTGNETTMKRGIEARELQKLMDVHLVPDSQLWHARNLFMFSFYAMGMPFVDMAFLRKEQISDGILTYRRHKTGKEVIVKVEPCMRKIVSLYSNSSSPYLFAFLHPEDGEAMSLRYYQSRLSCYNHYLRRLSELAGMQRPLTSYVARHSWASIANQQSVSLGTISQALGHTNQRTTMTYIKQLDFSALYKANKKVIESVKREE